MVGNRAVGSRSARRWAWVAAGAATVALVPLTATAGGRGKADPLVELGRRLFFDPAVSRSSDNSCASCHDPEHGFASRKRTDLDDFSLTRRHSQTLVDVGDSHRLHWDGEFDDVADLVEARLGTPSGARARHRAANPSIAGDLLGRGAGLGAPDARTPGGGGYDDDPAPEPAPEGDAEPA